MSDGGSRRSTATLAASMNRRVFIGVTAAAGVAALLALGRAALLSGGTPRPCGWTPSDYETLNAVHFEDFVGEEVGDSLPRCDESTPWLLSREVQTDSGTVAESDLDREQVGAWRQRSRKHSFDTDIACYTTTDVKFADVTVVIRSNGSLTVALQKEGDFFCW